MSDPLQRGAGRYCERQWRTVELPHELQTIPSMLSNDERRLLYSLAQATYTGVGAIVDAGCFLGGSTLAFGSGLLANPTLSRPPRIHSFDLFRLDAYMIQHYLDPSRDGRRAEGDSCRDLFDRNVASVASMLDVHHGDLCAIGWKGQPIEVLFLDILKSAGTNDVVLQQFFPSLIPRRSIVIQQDYVHERHFWIHVTMERLRDYFTFIEFVEFSSTVYLLHTAIPPAVLDSCMWDALSPEQKLHDMSAAIARWQGYPRGVLECVRALLRAYLGDFRGALDDLDRIKAAYHWSDHVIERAESNEGFIGTMNQAS